MSKVEGLNLHNSLNTPVLPHTVVSNNNVQRLQYDIPEYSYLQNKNSFHSQPSYRFHVGRERSRPLSNLTSFTNDKHHFGYESPRSSIQENEPFFIPSFNEPIESGIYPNHIPCSYNHSNLIYPSRFSNFTGEEYDYEPFERDYPRRGTFDVSCLYKGPVDRHRFYSESILECGGNTNYLFRPRLNAETHLQLEEIHEDFVPEYNSRLFQTESVDPQMFTPMENSPKPPKRKIPKKVSEASSSHVLNPEDIDPSVNPGVFSGRKPRKNMDYSKFRINLDAVRNGNDLRLTLMIRNIPNCFDQDHMLDIFDSFAKNEYDFFYMPVDFNTNCNLGFGYISMISTESVLKVYNKLNGKRWNTTSLKVCEITYARMQGKTAMEKFCKDWTIMSLPTKYRPVFFNKEIVIVDGIETVVMKRVLS